MTKLLLTQYDIQPLEINLTDVERIVPLEIGMLKVCCKNNTYIGYSIQIV